MNIGPIWVTKYHVRRWVLQFMQKVDPTNGNEWTERWAFRRGWLESRDRERWFLRK